MGINSISFLNPRVSSNFYVKKAPTINFAPNFHKPTAKLSYNEDSKDFSIFTSITNVCDSNQTYRITPKGEVYTSTCWTSEYLTCKNEKIKKIYQEMQNKTQKGKINLSEDELITLKNEIDKIVEKK